MRLARWACTATLVLAGAVVGLQVPASSPHRLQPTVAPCSRCAAVQMAKKGKGKSKVSKAANKALAALEAMEAAGPLDNGLQPAVPEPIKKKKKKDKAAAAPAEPDPFDIPIPEGMAPAVPEAIKKKAKKAAAASVAEEAPPPAAAPKSLTMAQKVSLVCAELGLDGSLPVAKAVGEANEAMGVEPTGTLAEQVAELMSQLGIAEGAAAAPAEAPSPPPPAPPPPAPVAEEVVAEEAPVETVEEEEVAVVEAAVEEVEAEVLPAEEVEPTIKLSKKKQGKKKVVADGDGVSVEAETDQSGRRAMGGKRIETFADAPPGFAYLKLSNGQLRFRQQEVLRGVTWDTQTGQRVGLVGNNGAGKTTQLRVLAEELELDAGELIKSSPEISVAFLRQEFREDLRESRTLKEEFLSAFDKVVALEQEYAKCEEDLAGASEDPEQMQALLDRMAELQSDLDSADATGVERKVDKVLGAMGFTPEDAALPVSAFSGGWKMRIGLGKILLKEPQVLLLDEPTNHMDLESVEWLERYLIEQTSSLALVIVSHDREFLDRVSTKIVETEQGVAYSYNGNYRNFLEQKGEREALQMKDHQQQQKEIKALKGEINKLRPIESAAQSVRQKERTLEKLSPGGAEHIPRPFVDKKKFSFRFPPCPRCAPEVIELEGVSHGYGDSTLFSDIDLCIERGDRIAILGANGAGKSTLLRLIMGTEEARKGTAEIVAQNAVTQFFEQDQANVLPLEKTVMQTMEAAASDTDFLYEQLRALLGRFMFKDDKVNDELSTLSGGEKARVALCRMLLTPSNLLLLDEPTNHLDIAAKEVLEEAIQHFEGTVVMVSHDRYFVSQTANTILALEDGKLVIYEGDYKSYMEQNAEKVGDKVEARYIPGLSKIKKAPKIEAQPQDTQMKEKKKKNFGGKGGPSGNKFKGVKNAKRQAVPH